MATSLTRATAVDAVAKHGPVPGLLTALARLTNVSRRDLRIAGADQRVRTRAVRYA